MNQAPTAIKLSEILSALSFALDITEGQPEGHAARSCLIGMRLAQELRLSEDDRAALYYALLLKDLGCSSNAAKVCSLFGADDRAIKHDFKTVDWTQLAESFHFARTHAGPHESTLDKTLRIMKLGLHGPANSRALFQTRCDRGAQIARLFGLPEKTAEAIRALDEHWDGNGQPARLKGSEIPLLGRILCLAQTVEVFFSEFDLNAALSVATQRRGTWFDPDLVDTLQTLKPDAAFWARLTSADVLAEVAAFQPEQAGIEANDECLGRVALGFAQVIDAKSPWTFRHSEGVAAIASGIGKLLGMPGEAQRELHRAGLLHDIGKLGVSNVILDKPGRLTAEEFAQVKRHPEYTQRILERVPAFSAFADMAASHHEKLDGSGYHRGLTAEQLSRPARALCVADICDALLAERPYRAKMQPDQVLEIIRKDTPRAYCSECVDALAQFLPTYNPGARFSPGVA